MLYRYQPGNEHFAFLFVALFLVSYKGDIAQWITYSISSILIENKEVHQILSIVYNLTVENFHTYFVGKTGVWVHNIKTEPGQEENDIDPKGK